MSYDPAPISWLRQIAAYKREKEQFYFQNIICFYLQSAVIEMKTKLLKTKYKNVVNCELLNLKQE